MGRTRSAEHRLLVLGLLRMQEMHGYQLAEMVESHFGGSSRIKKPTLYDTLKRLDAEGSVTSRSEQEGNRPPRTVYSLTPQGQEEFLELLRDSIGTYREPDLRDESALMFLSVLPAEEVRSLLESRRGSLEALLEEQPEEDDPHHGALRAVASRRMHHLRAEVAWLDETLAGVPE
ncbi:MAG: PadR family transcriptional regulator [Actinomycetota bacterium]|jgi:DNA-binding PadR family transcriptional regulator|nr:PadR family transcriptional regulator [Actinomycetota bacterium]